MKMSRNDKIKLLQGIRDGVYSADCLAEPFEYCVIYNIRADAMYRISEQRKQPRPTLVLNKEEFQKWYNSVEELNKKRAVPHTINIIILEYVKGLNSIKKT
jgi:hypothetical protein